MVPSSIINLTNHEVLHNKTLCQVDYFFFIGSVFLSVWLLAVVSIERVIVVIFHRKPTWLFLSSLILFFAIFYLFTFIYGLLTDTIKPSRLWNYCFITAESKAGGVILSMISILSTLTILIVIISYTSIAIYVLKVNLDVRNKTTEYGNGSSKNIRRAFIRMILTVIAYIITNSFEIGLELREISVLQERSLLEELICSVMQMFNVMVNSTIILISNEQASENFWKLVRFWKSND
ncbi:hypothetical protein CONCODRAFT_11098 [Conidiobolus coronatus NRRL 28638]|uniref:G-protein coupled receptors family 1 profile domain-containing protein n=1 Tax=Conidiobolus coronatus (strain ATCC 28846 / CBS 209.66 / NRRL 28638) TaxID=796925 RepID=A0A137NVT0_CONC2|nr:hypothetical protein CONCODRAFT_11098 [Conidiobolus coronatus NRRL 28638]|eukprot:KXN66930.1 hypothetical protein CONCODRAFT_11098 [Conidiobolus coronatus NRRL 28638]